MPDTQPFLVDFVLSESGTLRFHPLNDAIASCLVDPRACIAVPPMMGQGVMDSKSVKASTYGDVWQVALLS